MSGDSQSPYPTVKVRGNTIINHEGYALKFSSEAENCEITNCYFYHTNTKFFNDPLLWIALKILSRRYGKGRKLEDALAHIYFHVSPTSAKGEE